MLKKDNKPELLAPAGDLVRLKWAIMYGADAVYIGGQNYSLRANANNFSLDEIKEATNFVHNHNKKIYVTINIVFHDKDFTGLIDYLKKLDEYKIDAIIISDLSIIDLIKEYNFTFEIHISTQQSTTNYESINYLKAEGVTRVVLGRETSLEEIKEIRNHTDVELETFIHGSMCVSYSGRCVLSNYFTMRDSNRGGCAQICRWDFDLQDENNQNISENKFTMCVKDLSMLKGIPDLVDNNISSLKIEGRMRSVYYIATVLSIYRNAIDSYVADKEKYKYSEIDSDILSRCSNRENAVQFLYKKTDVNDQYYSGRQENTNQEFLGIVKSYDKETKTATIEQRNFFKTGDKIEVFSPVRQSKDFICEEIFNEKGSIVEAARHPQEIVAIKIDFEVSEYDILRVKND